MYEARGFFNKKKRKEIIILIKNYKIPPLFKFLTGFHYLTCRYYSKVIAEPAQNYMKIVLKKYDDRE